MHRVGGNCMWHLYIVEALTFEVSIAVWGPLDPSSTKSTYARPKDAPNKLPGNFAS